MIASFYVIDGAVVSTIVSEFDETRLNVTLVEERWAALGDL